MMLVAARYPHRQIDGKVYDLTPLFTSLTDPEKYSLPTEWTLVNGRIFQIVGDGVLVRTEDIEFWNGPGLQETVFIKNVPELQSKADGDSIVAYALLSGVHKYKDVNGAVRTVRAYDFGISDPKEREIRLTLNNSGKTTNDRNSEAAEAMAAGLRSKKMAATNGVGRAQYSLGIHYLTVETNLELARHWLSKAATNGYPDALKKIPAQAQ